MWIFICYLSQQWNQYINQKNSNHIWQNTWRDIKWKKINTKDKGSDLSVFCDYHSLVWICMWTTYSKHKKTLNFHLCCLHKTVNICVSFTALLLLMYPHFQLTCIRRRSFISLLCQLICTKCCICLISLIFLILLLPILLHSFIYSHLYSLVLLIFFSFLNILNYRATWSLKKKHTHT